MVQFGSGYFMAMDREYGTSKPNDPSTNDIGVGVGDVGQSIGLGPVANMQQLGAKIRAGTKTTELTFMGAGKGTGQAHTPEYYGEMQRTALREMQTANKFDFTTHATVGIMGLAGIDQHGNFSKQSKNMAVNEIKRAIEFAGDVGQGGPVTVHTGEVQRPVVDAEWNQEREWAGKFRLYPEEEERASWKVVDTRSGQTIQEARKNRRVARPIWNKYEPENGEYWEKQKGRTYVDQNGQAVNPGDYIDYFGNKISPDWRVPRYNKETRNFDTWQMEWQDLVKEAEEMTQRAKEDWHKWQRGEMTTEDFKKRSLWGRFADIKKEEDIVVRPEEAYIISTLETQAANARGWAYYYGGDHTRYVEILEKLKKAKEFYQKIEETTDESEKWKLKQQARALAGGLVPMEAEFPTVVIDKEMRDVERHIKHAQEASASQWLQAEEQMETMRYVESAETYAVKEAYDAYAEAGIKAMMQSDKLEQQKKLKQPLAVAMENLFPENYGAHPEELIHLVEGSREKMAQLLVQRGMAAEQARKEAQEHITATFDTGHLNMWRKYWQGDPHKSMEENDEEFNKWVVEKVGKMAERNIIGHLHLVDNYGYQDDHLAPGQGNTPIKEIVKTLKEKGFKGKMIVEPGADWNTDISGFHSVMKAWRLFGSPIYGRFAPPAQPGRGWGQVQYGYFGQNQPPYFIFGGYSPSEDWTLWSGVPLE